MLKQQGFRLLLLLTVPILITRDHKPARIAILALAQTVVDKCNNQLTTNVTYTLPGDLQRSTKTYSLALSARDSNNGHALADGDPQLKFLDRQIISFDQRLSRCYAIRG